MTMQNLFLYIFEPLSRKIGIRYILYTYILCIHYLYRTNEVNADIVLYTMFLHQKVHIFTEYIINVKQNLHISLILLELKS